MSDAPGRGEPAAVPLGEHGDAPAPARIDASLAAGALVVATVCSMWFATWNLYHTQSLTTRMLWDSLLFAALALPTTFLLCRALGGGKPRPVLGPAAALAALAVSAGLLVFVIVRNGYCQFDATTFGYLSELAYRQYLGQTPNVDFFFYPNFDFLLGTRILFPLFGVRWGAFVIFAAAVAVLALLWHYWLLRRLGWTPIPALFFTFALQTMVSVVNAFWYYNQTASMAAISLLLSTLYVIRRPERWPAWISFLGAFLWVMTSKPNGFLMLPGCLLAVALCGKRAVALGGLCAILAAGLWAALARVSNVPILPLFEGLSEASRGRMGLFSSPYFKDVTVVEVVSLYVLLLPCVIGWLIAGARRLLAAWPSPPARRRALAEALCTGTTVLTGMIFAQTNAALKCSDISVALTAWAVALYASPAHDSAREPRWDTRGHAGNLCAALLVTVVFLLSSMAWGHVRRHPQAAGPGFGLNPSVRSDVPAFLKGQSISEWFYGLSSGLVRYNALTRGSSVYYGPRLGFAYPAFGITPPEGLPMLWQDGLGLRASLREEYVRTFISKQFDYLVFMAYDDPSGQFFIDTTFMGRTLRQYISRNYVLVDRWRSVALYKRR